MVTPNDVPAIIRKEVRVILAFKMLSIIYHNSKATYRVIYKMMNDYFHGTDTIMSHMDMFLSGDGVYKAALIDGAISTVTDSTGVQIQTKILNMGMFVLNQEYAVGKHLNRKILETKTAKASSGLITGRMLFTMAQGALKNMKKTLAVLLQMPEVTAITPFGCEYKSGISEEEVKIILLQNMYIEFKGKDDEQDDDNDEEQQNNATNEINDSIDVEKNSVRPDNWYFNGWFAFCMFGPFVEEKDRITLLEIGGTKSDNNLENGRKQVRKEKRKSDDDERNNDTNNNRGFSVQMRIELANLELRSESIGLQKKERKLMALNCEMAIVQKKIDRAEKRATNACLQYDADHFLWKKVDMYELESTNLQMKIAEQINDSPPPKRTKVTDSPPDTPILKTRKTIHNTIVTSEKVPPVNVITIDIMSASASVNTTSIASGTTTSISSVTNTAEI